MEKHKEQYDNLILRVQSENRGIEKLKDHGKYFNIHHIIPKSLGGSDDISNLIKFTHEEHFEAHRLLYLIYKETKNEYKMAHAFQAMSMNEKFTARDYSEAIRSMRVIGISNETRKKMSDSQSGEKNPMYGKGFKQIGEKNPMYKKGHLIAGDKNGMYGFTGNKNPFYGKNHSDEFAQKQKERFGNKIVYKGIEYLSVRDANRITGDSRYLIKKNGTSK